MAKESVKLMWKSGHEELLHAEYGLGQTSTMYHRIYLSITSRLCVRMCLKVQLLIRADGVEWCIQSSSVHPTGDATM